MHTHTVSDFTQGNRCKTYFFLNAQYVTIIKSKMMEQDGISWTIIAGVLLKHEECPSWRNMQQIWLLLHVIAHSGLLFSKQIEQLYKMSFEIPFSMSRTHLGLPLWCLKSIWLGPILHWSHHLLVKNKTKKKTVIVSALTRWSSGWPIW